MHAFDFRQQRRSVMYAVKTLSVAHRLALVNGGDGGIIVFVLSFREISAKRA